jgi:hypothetical protein
VADLPRIIDALNTLRLELGPDIDEFIDYDAFLRRRDLVEHCRQSVERSIGRMYLPGFRFASTDHARWHFRHRDFMPFWVMDLPSREEHFLDNWIRAAFVPSYKHYCFEIADALKRFDENVLRTVSEFRTLTETGDKANISRSAQIIQIRRAGRNLPPGPINAPGDLMGMDPWTTRIKKLLPASALPTTERSLHRWPAQAQSQRKLRAQSDLRSAWRIKYIFYLGGMKCPAGHDPRAWNELYLGYHEAWEWVPPRKMRAPTSTSTSFSALASQELWSPSARRVRYEYDK